MSRLRDAWRAFDARWRATWAHDLNAPGARARARYDMNVNDHGFLRRFWTNREEFAPGAWRSNQPSPRQVAEIADLGIKGILNFRGPSDWGSYLLEQEACDEHGIELVNVRLYSRKAPHAYEIHNLIEAFERVPRPFLLHCKSGADRAGLGAAVYLLHIGRPPEQAAEQLSMRYLHVSRSKTGILDAFIEAYRMAHAETGIGFLDWVDNVYDPVALKAAFQPSSAGNILVDWILRRE
ncbi:tyrosine-protein phosphatase [Nioella nitratireducens]|uniref:tyrosine-protein phosphatase n=1 Tax=Nioella nitratireducens TaxID=1287720 RepID=UPI0009FCC5E4|nr:tyrosine-protein phosphatase [Nioella nitratireducens]